VFDPGRLLGVRVGNLNECKGKHMESRLIGNPSFYLLNRGASLKPPWPKPSLGKKREGEEKEYTRGICGYHSGARTMATRVLRAGYFWPSIEADCQDHVRKCKPCQKHGNLIHHKQEQLHHILSPWPFAKWGMDILGPFSPGKGQVKFQIVVVDYFTKWIEAKPLTTITA